MVCLAEQIFFEGCRPQILLDPLLNTLSKIKIIFFIKQDISFFFFFFNFFYSWKSIFLKIPKISIASLFFLPMGILKIIDTPWQNPRHLLTAEGNFER